MKLSVHCIGKPTSSWQIEALSTYKKRIGYFINMDEFSFNTPKRHRNASVTKLMEKEHNLLTSPIEPGWFVVLLDETGKVMDSKGFSLNLSKWISLSNNVAFLIGGPDGHHQKTKQMANQTISLSRFTLPHIFARIMLYEQIYRAFTLTNNHPYHR